MSLIVLYVLVVLIANEKINIFGKNCKNFLFFLVLFNGILSAKYLYFLDEKMKWERGLDVHLKPLLQNSQTPEGHN